MLETVETFLVLQDLRNYLNQLNKTTNMELQIRGDVFENHGSSLNS